MLRCLVAAVATALATGCAPDPSPPVDVPGGPTYRIVTDSAQIMEWILDPAADVIWDSAGFIITAEGETDLRPTTPEGWARVRNSAALIAESGNLLMLPGRSAGPEWVAYAQALTEAGWVAMAAAQSEDAQALFDAGGQLYQACLACHEQYMLPFRNARANR